MNHADLVLSRCCITANHLHTVLDGNNLVQGTFNLIARTDRCVCRRPLHEARMGAARADF